MDSRAAWLRELEHPTEGFFRAFAGRICEPEGLRGAAREAVIHLTPRVDWEGHLPQMPHGLLGLRAALRLKEHLSEARFLRLVATQLFAMAQEPRAPRGLQALGLGSIITPPSPGGRRWAWRPPVPGTSPAYCPSSPGTWPTWATRP